MANENENIQNSQVADDTLLDFYPRFSNFVALYRGITRTWIDEQGVLWAEFVDGSTQEIGPVASYYYAVQSGYTGTVEEWIALLLSVSDNAESAASSASAASQSETAASQSATSASASASTAEQWATGNTGGTPTATNNSKYYSEQAATSSQSAASSASTASEKASDAATSESNAQQYASNANSSAQAAAQSAAEIANLKGVPNGLAELDSSGLVPSSQLPSYVDDVLEYQDEAHFPVAGESGKIYIDLSTNKSYRWSGSTYVVIASDLALGETSSTAYRGDHGKAAYDAAVVNVDSTPTTNSTHLITSGGVKAALPGTMTGATSSAAGTSGLVPQPSAGDEGKVLKGNGTWDNVDALPTVTSSDNNKVLEVVDGEWATGSKKIDKEYESSGYTDIWEAKTWSGLTSFAGQYVWSDGDNIYYSNSSNQYVLNKSTSTWSEKSWTGLTGFYGYNTWSDGDNIYHSNSSYQYVLNKSTSTWSTKSWTGLTIFSGSSIWSDGDNIYYSRSSKQYVLDKSTSTWSAKTWTGLTSFDGSYVWSDGDNIYYSYNTDQYVLNKSTSTWSTKSWTGLTNFNGNLIWKAGNNIYYSNSSTQRVLDKSTSTWSANSWTTSTGFLGVYGYNIWSDGDNIYYSNDIDQYVLVEDIRILLGANGKFNSTYLPNFRNLILPSVTSDDNGKVLEVSSKGSWVTGTKKALENNSLYYGVCTSAASASTKTVTIPDFPYTSSTIPSGIKIVILFENANTTSPVTLSVNNISYTMLRDRSTAVADYDWNAGELIEVVYLVDGSYHRWMMVNRPYADDTYKGLVSLGDYSTNAYPGNKGAAAYAAAITNVDTEPTIASTHLVTSGGVATALSNLPDAKTITITGTITNTSGSYSGSISDERVTADMKAIALELGNIDAFNSDVTVSCGNGSITISCSDFSGTSTIKVTALKTTEITSNYIVYSESEAPSNPTAGLIWLKKV